MTNKKLGNDFEAAFCEILSQHGFWAHQFAQNQAGQPADVMAVKDGKAHLIDCKVCSGRGFPLSRIEDNQHAAMDMWSKCGNGDGWFALLFKEKIYMIQHYEMLMFEGTLVSLPGEVIRQFGTLIEDWVRTR